MAKLKHLKTEFVDVLIKKKPSEKEVIEDEDFIIADDDIDLYDQLDEQIDFYSHSWFKLGNHLIKLPEEDDFDLEIDL